jgi:hypothetical protein
VRVLILDAHGDDASWAKRAVGGLTDQLVGRGFDVAYLLAFASPRPEGVTSKRTVLHRTDRRSRSARANHIGSFSASARGTLKRA